MFRPGRTDSGTRTGRPRRIRSGRADAPRRAQLPVQVRPEGAGVELPVAVEPKAAVAPGAVGPLQGVPYGDETAGTRVRRCRGC
ncbi:hypothetical protein GCM10020227_14030 [Streptomyces flavovirens]